ncbi:MAG TPA: hypothetical protein VGD45_27330 [Steroidobacter sp.]|uniref:hypothetical protein n=1 Tax=Steroidobacter sp. TaxID=1978227 RepID=UPI002ED7DC56
MKTAEIATIVQCIATDWTKQSRGFPGAIKRNATPQALRLPLEERPQGCSFIEHEAGFWERRDFEDPHLSISFESLTPGRTLRYGGVHVVKEDNRLRVSWIYTPEDVGMPPRPQKKKDVFELALNQWARVIYNGRFDGGEHAYWTYRKTVLNIGLFEEVAASVFIETMPDVIMDKTAIVY